MAGMKVVFSALSAYGHIFPMFPFAQAMRDAGHDVLFATAEDYLPVVHRAGLRGVRASEPLLSTTTTIHGVPLTGDDLTPQEVLDRAGRVLGDVVPREFVADLVPILRDFRPDVVIHDPGNPGAGLAAHIVGIPAFNHAFGRAPRGALFDASNVYFRPYAAELGLELPEQYPGLLGNPTIDICPASLQRADFLALDQRLEIRPVAYSEPGDLPRTVQDDGRPLAYVTLGTIHGAADVLRQVISALTRFDLRVLVATGPSVDPAELGPLPESVSAERWVPQGRLWPHVDVTVHHGGSGTTLGSLAAGVPQLISPHAADQPTNARAIEQAGAGLSLAPADLTADTVAEKLDRILTDESFRMAAKRLRHEIEQMPSPAELAARFPELI
jgi:Erythromycin biosynthesis protein CIII-like, C-terminal domain/Erythromycin biosynthesis protein CIII-like, N-terminal domain